jgi:flagellar protein FlbD
MLTRLGCGLRIALNPDLIERAEHTPDTVITLVDGHKVVVEEPLEAVVALVRDWRASVAAEAITLARMASTAPHTSALTSVRANEIAHPTEDLEAAEEALLADKNGHGSHLGQILRLPSREV